MLIIGLLRTIERLATFQVTIQYTGIFKDNLVGLYQSTYDDDLGLKHMLAATHMEPNNARRVSLPFPRIVIY